MDKPQEWVDMTVTQGVGFPNEKGSASVGETIRVPADTEENGIPPMRWWEYTGKAMQDPKAAKEAIAELQAAAVIAEPEKAAK